MNITKIKIDGHLCRGTAKEESHSSRPSKNGSGDVVVHLLAVDLEIKCEFSKFSPAPPAEVEVDGVWKSAEIVGIPTTSESRRIWLSVEECNGLNKAYL